MMQRNMRPFIHTYRESFTMDLEIREIDCAQIEGLRRDYPQEMAVVIEMQEEIGEIPCPDVAA